MVERPDSSRENADPVAPPPGPGERLRRAREGAGLDLDRLAAELHLPARILEALERDDFGSLPPTYTQGYLRSYAKRLGLAVDPVLAEYHRRAGPVEPPPMTAPAPPPSQVGLGRTRHGLYVLFAVLAVAVFLAWWFRGGSGPRPVPPQSSPPPAPAVTSPQAAPPIAPAPAPVPAARPPLPRPAVSGPPQAAPSIASSAAPAEEAAPVPRAGTTAASAASSPSPSLAPSLAPSPADVLVLQCDADSWVEVRDARGRRLVYDLLHAGNVRRVVGTPPFRVLLGNPAAVRIEWDGRRVPVPRGAPGKVVRFSVGTPSAAAAPAPAGGPGPGPR